MQGAPVRAALAALGLALAGCSGPPPTHLEGVQAAGDGAECARACLMDISEEIDRLKPAHPELSGWRPAKPGIRSLTYDYKSCRVWLDFRRAEEKQPAGNPRLRLPALGLNVYCQVEASAATARAVEAALRKHLDRLAELDRRRGTARPAAPPVQGRPQ
jgi:hypothetical protein